MSKTWEVKSPLILFKNSFEMAEIGGGITVGKRNFKAIASDISEGFIALNPIYLKSFDEDMLKSLYNVIERQLTGTISEPFPYNNAFLIRKRNLRLQRLYSALIIIKNFASEKRYRVY